MTDHRRHRGPHSDDVELLSALRASLNGGCHVGRSQLLQDACSHVNDVGSCTCLQKQDKTKMPGRIVISVFDGGSLVSPQIRRETLAVSDADSNSCDEFHRRENSGHDNDFRVCRFLRNSRYTPQLTRP